VAWQPLSTVVIYYFSIVGVSLSPAKADSPLIVDPDGVLTAGEFLQPMAGNSADFIESNSRVNGNELLQRTPLEIGPQASTETTEEELGCLARRKAFDHDRL
jgi:hypothetical protein